VWHNAYDSFFLVLLLLTTFQLKYRQQNFNKFLAQVLVRVHSFLENHYAYGLILLETKVF
jgi:hypothetical protein